MALSDLFRLYRFERVVLEICSAVATSGGAVDNDAAVVIGFVSGSPSTAPTTFAEVAQLDETVVRLPGQTIPARLELGARQLAGLQNWYLTHAAGDTEDDTQGRFYVSAGKVATAASGLSVVIRARWWMALKERVPAAVSLERLRQLLPDPDAGGYELLTSSASTGDAKAPLADASEGIPSVAPDRRSVFAGLLAHAGDRRAGACVARSPSDSRPSALRR
jgi:hypothetical protein